MEAQVVVKMTPHEFDLLRRALTAYVEDRLHVKNNSGEGAASGGERHKAGMEAVSAGDLLEKLR